MHPGTGVGGQTPSPSPNQPPTPRPNPLPQPSTPSSPTPGPQTPSHHPWFPLPLPPPHSRLLAVASLKSLRQFPPWKYLGVEVQFVGDTSDFRSRIQVP